MERLCDRCFVSIVTIFSDNDHGETWLSYVQTHWPLNRGIIFIMLLSLSGLGQKWREFKIKARRNSWAVEHRNQFPVPPAESDEEDEDTS